MLREVLLKSQLAGSVKFAVLYETLGRLEHESRGGRLAIPLSPSNAEVLRKDLKYLEENYFSHPSYLKLEGRPVVVLYLARCLERDLRGALGSLRDRVYLLGDLVYWHGPSLAALKAFDGVTAYNMHTNSSEVLGDFERLLLAKYGEWAKAAARAGVDFVPSALPGFDDSAIGRGNLPLPGSADLFRERLRIAFKYAGERGVVLVTSFNEWHEYTSVEPSREYGRTYLETLLEEIRTQSVSGR